MLQDLRQQPVVAVDTESDSLYSYYYKVCLIQISVPGVDYLVDPLSMCDATPLGSLFANPKVQKIFHAAESDVIALKRDYGFAFTNIFDTLWAARVLGWEHLNLAAYLERNRGFSLVAVDPAGHISGVILCGHDGARGYIRHLAVAHNARGQGLARDLIGRCLDGLRSLGIHKCTVHIFSDNEDGLRFWRHLGWIDRHDLRVMQVILTESEDA